jgi:hypothetical protein
VDRPAETAWLLRPEDWRGQVPSRRRTTTTKTGSVPLLSVSWQGTDLTRAGIPVLWVPSTVCPCLVISFCCPWPRLEEMKWLVGLGHHANTVRKTLGFCLLALYYQKQAASLTKATSLTKGCITWRSACRVREGHSEGVIFVIYSYFCHLSLKNKSPGQSRLKHKDCLFDDDFAIWSGLHKLSAGVPKQLLPPSDRLA